MLFKMETSVKQHKVFLSSPKAFSHLILLLLCNTEQTDKTQKFCGTYLLNHPETAHGYLTVKKP